MKRLLFLLTIVFILSPVNLLANKTSVSVKAPSGLKKGSEITVVINVMHKGNSKMHHTDWVSLRINGKEAKRWEYNKENLPPAGDFTLEYKTTITGDLDIEVQGNCNLHGSAGPINEKVKAD
jgi:desulfoferrodoxin (superoxide reductase-like protein)